MKCNAAGTQSESVTKKNILIARKWERSPFRRSKLTRCQPIQPSCWGGGDCSAQTTSRTVGSHCSSNVWQKAGELSSITHRQRKSSTIERFALYHVRRRVSPSSLGQE